MMKPILLGTIRAYQTVLSPLLGPSCRFQPTCSAYAAEAIRRHGAWSGGALAVRRLCRCHPWGGSGWDPVPEERPTRPAPAGPSPSSRHPLPIQTDGHAPTEE